MEELADFLLGFVIAVRGLNVNQRRTGIGSGILNTAEVFRDLERVR